MMKRPLPAILLPLCLLAGCATDTEFPSLAPRPVEALARAPERDRTRDAVVDPALDALLPPLSARVDAADRDWSAALGQARTAVGRARGAAAGSEPWVLAQQAIGRLDAARTPMTDLVERLDRLRFAQAERSTPVDTGRLDALWQRAVDLSTAQNTAYAELSTAIPIS